MRWAYKPTASCLIPCLTVDAARPLARRRVLGGSRRCWPELWSRWTPCARTRRRSRPACASAMRRHRAPRGVPCLLQLPPSTGPQSSPVSLGSPTGLASRSLLAHAFALASRSSRRVGRCAGGSCAGRCAGTPGLRRCHHRVGRSVGSLRRSGAAPHTSVMALRAPFHGPVAAGVGWFGCLRSFCLVAVGVCAGRSAVGRGLRAFTAALV